MRYGLSGYHLGFFFLFVYFVLFGRFGLVILGIPKALTTWIERLSAVALWLLY